MTDAPTPNTEMAPPSGDSVADPTDAVAAPVAETAKKTGRGKFAGFVGGAAALGLIIGLGIGWLGFGNDGNDDHGSRRPQAQQMQNQGNRQKPQGGMQGPNSQNQQGQQNQQNQNNGSQASPSPSGPQGGQSYGGRSRAS